MIVMIVIIITRIIVIIIMRIMRIIIPITITTIISVLVQFNSIHANKGQVTQPQVKSHQIPYPHEQFYPSKSRKDQP